MSIKGDNVYFKSDGLKEVLENKHEKKNGWTSIICHQIPERSFKINGKTFPVCARCTGIYTGAFSYFLLVSMVQIQYSALIMVSGILMIIPTFLDGFTQLTTSRESKNSLRFSTGIIGGLGLGILVKALKYYIILNLA